MNTVQLEITLDAETKQRVETAAAEKSVSVKAYMVTAIRHRLAEDGYLEKDQADIMPRAIFEAEILQEIEELRAIVENTPSGEPIDTVALLHLVRAERDAEILGLLKD